MGGKINKSLFVDHDGKRVYACCAGCLPDLKKDPAKYISQLEAKGVTLDKASAKAEPPAAAPAQGHDHAGHAAPAQGDSHSGHGGCGCGH